MAALSVVYLSKEAHLQEIGIIHSAPDGQITKSCQVLRRKIFRFRRRANHRYKLAPSRPARGAYRDRHGRWARDAVDAAASARQGNSRASLDGS
jgi:hypothetical protein